MTRRTLVTRTIATRISTVMVVNTETKQVLEIKVYSNANTSEKNILKQAQSIVSENEKVVDIMYSCTEEKLYAMSEEQFIAHATAYADREELSMALRLENGRRC